MAIKSFSDKTTETIFYRDRGYSKARRRLPVELWDKAREIFDALDGAEELRDLEAYELDQKKGDREGEFSTRINDQYRIYFSWDDGDARRVDVVDYH